MNYEYSFNKEIKINLPINVSKIINKLTNANFECFVVGGCVRDSLLNLTPNDWDLCTNATPDMVKEIFNEYKIIDTGLKHGTVTLVIEEVAYELTTYRTESEYENNRKPKEVYYVSDLLQDLSRRDFTINAIAYNPHCGIVDSFNGINDLRSNVLKCVGNAEERFSEDALRIMRAFRFAKKYGLSISEDVKIAIKNHKQLLRNISNERIQSELIKLFTIDTLGHKQESELIEEILIEYSEVFEVIIPEIAPMFGLVQNNPYHKYDVWGHTIKAISSQKDRNIYVRLAMLFHDMGKPQSHSVDDSGVSHFYGHSIISFNLCQDIMKRLKFDNKTIEIVSTLVKFHEHTNIIDSKKAIKKLMNKVEIEIFPLLFLVWECDMKAQSEFSYSKKIKLLSRVKEIYQEIIQEAECFTIKDLNINGNDLIKLGYAEGIEIGKVLNLLLEEVIDENLPLCNEQSALIKRAQEIKTI